MPVVPSNTKCAQLGCKEGRSRLNTYCELHGGRNSVNNTERRQQDVAYASSFWRQTRRKVLSIQPLCQSCLIDGRVTQAKHVDHLFAWKLIGQEAFQHNIFQSLCPNCHSVKTGLEIKGIFRHYLQTTIDYKLIDYKGVVYSRL